MSLDWGDVTAVAALCIALYRSGSARRANIIAATTPWANVLMKYIEDEFKSVAEDMDLMRTLCTVPMQDQGRKREIRSKLNELREGSDKRVYLLGALAVDVRELQARKAAVDGLDDSYFDNAETLFPTERADVLLKKYYDACGAYLDELQRFAIRINLQRGRALPGLLAQIRSRLPLWLFGKPLPGPPRLRQ